jgi:fructosamine-3-kinase
MQGSTDHRPVATSAADTRFRREAEAVLAAGRSLRATLGEQASSDGYLTIMLHILAYDEGRGVATASCCAAVDAPRTTALRWITALADQRLVLQQQDQTDRRITMLRLSDEAVEAVQRWLLAIGGR